MREQKQKDGRQRFLLWSQITKKLKRIDKGARMKE